MIITLQIATTIKEIPSADSFENWAAATLADQNRTGSVCIRIIDETESRELNEQYRHKQGPTNVLAFPVSSPPEYSGDLLGDIAICANIVNAGEIPWARIVIHGILHLLGYEHETEQEAKAMEAIEARILSKMER